MVKKKNYFLKIFIYNTKKENQLWFDKILIDDIYDTLKEEEKKHGDIFFLKTKIQFFFKLF